MIKIHLHNSKVDDIHAFIRHARWKWRKSRTRMARFREFPRQQSRHVLRSIEDARLYTVKARNQPVNVVKRAVWFAARSVLDRYASAEDQTRYFDIENESYAENKLDSKIISILPCFLLRCELSCIWLCEFRKLRIKFKSLKSQTDQRENRDFYRANVIPRKRSNLWSVDSKDQFFVSRNTNSDRFYFLQLRLDFIIEIRGWFSILKSQIDQLRSL